MSPIPVIDLKAQYLALKAELDAATQRVLNSGWYILGKEVAAFEAEFAAYLSAGHGETNEGASQVSCVGVNSGTDALHLALLALDIRPGDEVITVSHTAVATVAAIRLAGATPVLVDIDPATYTMAPAALAAAITPQTKAIIPVHLYGHPAALDEILALAAAHAIPVIEDCAQAHGARYRGQAVGTFGDLACFSFYPTKNLGALGDGGAVVGRDPALMERVRSLREYGWTTAARYVSQREGLNSRLDEMQAALLRVKLRHLDDWNDQRRVVAATYAAQLSDMLVKPVALPACHHVYHLYVVQLPPTADRDAIRQQLATAGIGTAIHYPASVHQQPAYQEDNVRCHPMAVTEQILPRILSLPLYPQMNTDQAAQVAAALNAQLALGKSSQR